MILGNPNQHDRDETSAQIEKGKEDPNDPYGWYSSRTLAELATEEHMEKRRSRGCNVGKKK